MHCAKCKGKMICDDSQEDKNVRYRTYVCPKCGKRIGTVEQEEEYFKVVNRSCCIKSAHRAKREVRYEKKDIYAYAEDV